MTRIRPFKPNYGTGALGDLVISANTNWSALTGTAQTMNYHDLTINAGVTLTLDGGYKPHIIRCTGTLTVNGAIAGTGRGFGAANNGYRTNSNENRTGWKGEGPGGGNTCRMGWGDANYYGGYNNPNTLPTGAGHGTAGTAHATPGGSAYSALGELLKTVPDWSNLCGSQGGGGNHNNGDGETGGVGGYGGGGLLAEARKGVVNLAASIVLNGANSAAPSGTGTYSAPGSGGGFLLLADIIEFPATGTVVTAIGGTATGSTAAGVGEVILCYLHSISPTEATAAARCNPVATVINLATLPKSLG